MKLIRSRRYSLRFFSRCTCKQSEPGDSLKGLDRGIEVAMLLEKARQLGAELAFFLLCHVPQWFKRPPGARDARRNPNKYRALEERHQGREVDLPGRGLAGI